MHLVDEEDDIALALDLVDKAFDPALELTSELSARHKSGEVKQVYLLILQLRRHIARGYTQGKPLGNGSLADARLTDKARVVFCAPAKDLYRTIDLVIPADYPVYPARSRLGSEVGTVLVEELALTLALALILFAPPFLLFGCGFLLRGLGGGVVAVHCGEILEERHSARSARLKAAVLSEHCLELLADIVQLILGYPHALHYLLDGADIHFKRAFDTKTLLRGFIALHFGDEKHCGALFTSGA